MKRVFVLYKDLIKRVCCTLVILMVFELGTQIAVPGINPLISNELGNNNFSVQVINAFSGARLQSLNLFSIGLGPYMTALILWQTITMLDPDSSKKMSRRKQGFIQKAITIVIAIVQALQITIIYKKRIPHLFINTNTNVAVFETIVMLVAGALFLTWLGDRNTDKGIGGPVAIIIPSMLANVPNMLVSGMGGGKFKFTVFNMTVVGIATVVILWATVFLNKAELRIPIQRTGISTNFTNSYLPIRFLSSGAMPFMFSMSLFVIPTYFTSNNIIKSSRITHIVKTFFSLNTVPGILTYGVVIILLGYGFSFINVRVADITKDLKESGDYILNVCPGKDTEKYINKQLLGIVFMSNSYFLIISVIPLILNLFDVGMSNLAFYFGGIIIVVTMLDNITQQFTALLTKDRYEIFEEL